MTQLVVAIGGNALQPAGEAADAAAQRRRIEATASRLTDLVAAGHDVVVTHGNGPQVGNILLQNEETRHLVPPMPLDVCGAESQALIGYLLAQALRNEFAARKIHRDVACVVTQVLVDAGDPAFANPTKPIGPYYLRDDEILVKKAKGWKMVYDQRGGWRRVVPSPRRRSTSRTANSRRGAWARRSRPSSNSWSTAGSTRSSRTSSISSPRSPARLARNSRGRERGRIFPAHDVRGPPMAKVPKRW